VYVAPSGFRYYSEEQLNHFLGTNKPITNKKVIGYCRVSSQKRKDDFERQIIYVKE